MRIVRWAPSERVDLPDLTAMSFLPLGEFRRTLRTLLTGDAAYIIRGFKVEPESPVSTRIRVRLQPPGEERGAALGGEQTSPGLDYGQLIGDRDSSFITEGASQQFIDFNGEPNGTYIIEMRFTYADGVSDNRAFWNAGSSSEFVQVTETRKVSGWQLQFVSSASGGQWIPLASVVWGGATIASGNITDTRTFLLEGTAPFSRATQIAAGGVEDFTRTATRADDAVGTFRIPQALRALMRQVQDLKGASGAGVWDWFSRIYKPYDPAGVLDAQLTKNLRTIDTITYSIGDGTTTFGDFNGASALNACLDHLESLSAGNKPERIEIVVNGGAVTYTITSGKLISSTSPLTITIRGAQTFSHLNSGLFGRPAIQIDGAGLGSNEAAVAVVGTGGGNLILRGLDVSWTGTSAGGRGMFTASGYIDAQDCNLTQGTLPDVAAGFVLLSSQAQRSSVDRCLIRGRMNFYDIGGVSSIASPRDGGRITNSRIEEGQLLLWNTGSGTRDIAVGFRIKDCTFVGRDTAIYTSSIALIDGRSAQALTIEGCEFHYGINENCIDARTFASTDAFRWTIRDCSFVSDVSNGSLHASGSGGSGASGTGWCIDVSSTTDGASKICIDNCRLGADSVDAGAIRLSNCLSPVVRACEVAFSAHQTGDTFQAIEISATGAGWLSRARVTDCLIHKWLNNSPHTKGIKLLNVDDVVIHGCTVRGDEFDGTNITTRTVNDCALLLDTCNDVRIFGNNFSRWNFGVTTACCLYVPSGSVCNRVIISNNDFEGNGSYAIRWVGATPTNGPTIAGNNINGTGDNDNLGIYMNAAGLHWTITGNLFRHNTGGTFDFIFFDTMGGGVLSGNRSNADVRKTGGVGVRGYAPDDAIAGFTQDLNLVNNYT